MVTPCVSPQTMWLGSFAPAVEALVGVFAGADDGPLAPRLVRGMEDDRADGGRQCSGAGRLDERAAIRLRFRWLMFP